MSEQSCLSYATLLRNTDLVLQGILGGRTALAMDDTAWPMALGVIALFEAMGWEAHMALDPAAHATFRQDLARLRERVRDPGARLT
ncbi:integrase (plasmid) [Burkholderia plantarii]|uniref:integrase n=1 Tax=Burkholderia plantarii TaxID=41899 RepID=UPI00272D25BD|nr:integrase [Burkholderia plantarii]WLE64206.1 integrase [Burkholderia plantarii]